MKPTNFARLSIQSPKRTKASQVGWHGFFPYYAGYPESFASELISSACLAEGSVVYDPWNGSGTTTFAATSNSSHAVGVDLNPAMVVVAKARLLPTSEADSIEPLGRKIVELARKHDFNLSEEDPLCAWFGNGNARTIRSIEESIRAHLVGSHTYSDGQVNLENLSSIAAANFVALFSVCRKFAAKFQSTNPTWIRYPREDENRPRVNNDSIFEEFLTNIRGMAQTLAARSQINGHETARPEIKLGDSTSVALPAGSVDMILTSPPYCTRIDYTAATRLELAVLHPLTKIDIPNLSRQMIGSVRVPTEKIEICSDWGETCSKFLRDVQSHPSKASSGYYYRTHLDYFCKMSNSIQNLSRSLKTSGLAVLVVQDSYYKDVYNDLPKMISEICSFHNLKLRRREDFRIQRTMAGLHPYSRGYKRPMSALEAVLCFEKLGG
nr:DNA methyltransferase [Bradyrhizobium nitroreducens]